MIQNLTLKRFKGIKDVSITLNEINVLIGANNSGKSSIIQGVHFAIGVVQSVLLSGLIFRRGATSLNPSQLIYTPSESVYSLGYGGTLKENILEAIEFSFVLLDGSECTIAIRKGKNRNINVSVSNEKLVPTIGEIAKPFSIFSPGLAGISKAESFVSDGVLLRTLARGDANLVLRNILWRLWGTDLWEPFIEDIHQIFPSIDLKIEYDETCDEHIKVFSKDSADWVPLELSGTGLLQAAQILSYIHRFRPTIILLDEPDSHLHPNNQRLLCTLLQNISDEHSTQVLITTHSRHVLDCLSGKCQMFWVRNGTAEVAVEDDEMGILLDVGALDIKERIADPSLRALVLTEDERTKSLQLLLEAAGFDLGKTAVLPYYGCTDLKNLRALIRMIQSVNSSSTILLHMDRDFRDPVQISEWEKAVRSKKVEPFITEGTDIESYFLRPDHLSELSTKCDFDYFEKLIDDTALAASDDLVAKYVNGKIDAERKAGRAAQIDHGKLAAKAPNDIKTDPLLCRHAKTLLRKVRGEYQRQKGENLVVYRVTDKIIDQNLEKIAKRINWKK